MNNEELDRLLAGIDFSPIPDGGIAAPPSEIEPKEIISAREKMKEKKVFVQKIITEIWVYTDTDGKTWGHQGLQDIVIVGDMDFEEAVKMIGDRKTKKKRNTEG